MNEVGPSLVTTYAFKNGREYIVKTKVTAFKGCQKNLELTVTDKHTGENWQSSYDAAWPEWPDRNLEISLCTPSYYKQNSIGRLKSAGPLNVIKANNVQKRTELQTSESITLDLLTYEDLELLRMRRLERNSCSSFSNATNNRRYLILTYTVEFDRIHYPLPLEYCGLPDPIILQATIKRLQVEIEKLQHTGANKHLQKRIEHLTIANQKLVQENQRLLNGGKGLKRILGSIKSLENSVAKERASFRIQIQKLKAENAALLLKVQLTASAGRKPGDGSPALKRHSRSPSIRSTYTNSRHSRSRSSSISSHVKTSRSSLSPGSSMESLRIRSSPSRNAKARSRTKDSKTDFESLESRIHTLQKMLKEGINLN